MADASIMPQLLTSANTNAPTIVRTELMHALSLNCPSAEPVSTDCAWPTSDFCLPVGRARRRGPLQP